MAMFGAGYKKVSKKSRHGRWKSRPVPHQSHRKKLPEVFDRDARRRRRMVLIELRAADLED